MTIETLLLWLTASAGLAVLVSGIDDLFIDLCYYGMRLGRRGRGPSEAELRRRPEQAIGVMIPAWQEHEVIGRMLRNTLRSVEYGAYEIFVGTYPNDEATRRAVMEVSREDARVHCVVCPHEGPTNKADCLNWIIEGVRLYEKKSGKRLEVLALQDSEDVIHPLAFKLMNFHVPRVPMVQLPVVPLETRRLDMTAGTYLDEFSESHLKDMLVRQRLSGMVPSAGVGTAFSRQAIDALARRHANQVFNVATFTEDYDLAFRLKALGGRSEMIHFHVERTRPARSGWLRGREEQRIAREIVGTREYFPSRFWGSIRQKARWTLGIVFHGWQQRGWEGGLGMRYAVWRDRKTLLTNSVNMLGYLLLAESGANAALGYRGALWEMAHPLVTDGWLRSLFATDALLLANRCLQRAAFVGRIAGPAQALLSLPRIVWGNVINFCAVARAAQLFCLSKLTGATPVWAKTAHAFPSEELLSAARPKLGDLLLEGRLLSLAQLSHALRVQKEQKRRLGEVLVGLGYVPEAEVSRVLAAQTRRAAPPAAS